MEKVYGQDNTPFFILGCVRSGTTMLRDLLRRHPRLECPEETHFFRWAEPYGSPNYIAKYKQKLLQKHRELDGINEFDFFVALKLCKTRKELMDFYGGRYLELMNNPSGRWFDKTPQNVYGLLLLSGYYPDAKFIHIYRNPLNVVTSLLEGKVMPKHGLIGGISYWNESMIMFEQFKKLCPDRILEVRYESLTENPVKYIAEMLDFLGEDASLMEDISHLTHPEKNKYKQLLEQEDVEIIRDMTEPYFSRYGYQAG